MELKQLEILLIRKPTKTYTELQPYPITVALAYNGCSIPRSAEVPQLSPVEVNEI